jgi:hypothetical protein
LIWYRLPTSALMKEGQVYYSNNILLNLETIFKIDNKKLMHGEPDYPPYISCKVRLVIIGIVVFSI